MRSLIITLGIIFMIMSQVNAQDDERDRVASEALKIFKKLVTEKDFEALGFESPDEVDDATLGTPVQTFMVGLDDLQEYQGGDPDELLSGGDEFSYPVLVREKVRSSIILMKSNDDWEAVSFGWPNLIILLTEIRDTSSERTGVPVDSFFTVRIPALNLYFLAYRNENNVLMLIPLLDDPDLKFQAGVAMSADAVLETILSEAQEHDGLPR
jgi:hypothetical protein